MNRRVVGLAVATVLALVGTVALVAFVSNAEARALQGEQLIEVYVVDTPVPAGTPGDQIDDFVTVEQVPVKVRPADAVQDLGVLAGLVAEVDLKPGEQLLAGRFVELSAFADRATGVQLPDDMVEVTVELPPERAVGGLIEPGQTVAVFASFEPFDLNSTVIPVDGEPVALPEAVADSIDASTPNSTEVIIRKALITAVQEPGGGGDPSREAENSRLDTSPSGAILVTLAVTPFDAERIIFTKEYGSMWLTAERETVPETKDSVKTRGNIYRDESDAR